jgi:hypothetical protein
MGLRRRRSLAKGLGVLRSVLRGPLEKASSLLVRRQQILDISSELLISLTGPLHEGGSPFQLKL